MIKEPIDEFFSKLEFLPLRTIEKPIHTGEKLLGRSFSAHFFGNLWPISEHIIDIPEDRLLVFLKPSNRQVNSRKFGICATIGWVVLVLFLRHMLSFLVKILCVCVWDRQQTNSRQTDRQTETERPTDILHYLVTNRT